MAGAQPLILRRKALENRVPDLILHKRAVQS
jgi:hypothetical protein